MQAGEDLELLSVTIGIAGIFKREPNDFQTLFPIPLVIVLQERRFLVTVRAPAPGDRNNDNLVPESFVSRRDEVSFEIRKIESQRFRAVAHLCVITRIRESRNFSFIPFTKAFSDDFSPRIE